MTCVWRDCQSKSYVHIVIQKLEMTNTETASIPFWGVTQTYLHLTEPMARGDSSEDGWAEAERH